VKKKKKIYCSVAFTKISFILSICEKEEKINIKEYAKTN